MFDAFFIVVTAFIAISLLAFFAVFGFVLWTIFRAAGQRSDWQQHGRRTPPLPREPPLQTVECSHCGSTVPAGNECPNCGAAISVT